MIRCNRVVEVHQPKIINKVSFYEELKRRNVLRVLTAYVVTTWLIVEVVETLFPIYGLSDAAIRLVITVLGIGLVPVLILSWIFELTPEGFKKDKDVDPSLSIAPRTKRYLDIAIMAVLALALGFFMFDKFVLDPARDANKLETARLEGAEEVRAQALEAKPPDRSIAVLPFINLSGDAENEYFSDGVSEEILNLLAKTRQLTVISRTSSFFFKNKEVDIPHIAERLNVRYVLEGSFRRSGDRIRIAAQLVDTDTIAQIWSDTYDRELVDIFAVQDDIANRIYSVLKKILTGDENNSVIETISQTENLEAYQLYLRGLSLLRLRGIDNIKRSIELFEQAIVLDPVYARAYSQLAVACSLVPFYSSEERSPWHDRALAMANKALELDSSLAGPHATLAGIYFSLPSKTKAAAEAEYIRAIELDPAYVTARQWYAEFLMPTGKARQALEVLTAAHDLDPLSPSVNAALAWSYYLVGDYTSAERFGQTALELGMGGTWAEDVLGLVYVQTRQLDKALAMFEMDHRDFELNRLIMRAIADPELNAEAIAAIDAIDYSRISYSEFDLLLLIGEYDLALDRALIWAEKQEIDMRTLWRPHALKVARDERFKSMVRTLGLVEYWRESSWPDFCRPEGDDFSCDAAYFSAR